MLVRRSMMSLVIFLLCLIPTSSAAGSLVDLIATLDDASDDCSHLIKVRTIVLPLPPGRGGGNIPSYEIQLPRGVVRIYGESSYIAMPEPGKTWDQTKVPTLARVEGVKFDSQKNPYFLIRTIHDAGSFGSDSSVGLPLAFLPSRIIDAFPSFEARDADGRARELNFIRTPFLQNEGDLLVMPLFDPTREGESSIFDSSVLEPYRIPYVTAGWPGQMFDLHPNNVFAQHRDYLWIISEQGQFRLVPLNIRGVSQRRLADGDKILAAGQLELSYLDSQVDRQKYLISMRANFKGFKSVTPEIRAAVDLVLSTLFWHQPNMRYFLLYRHHMFVSRGIRLPEPTFILE